MLDAKLDTRGMPPRALAPAAAVERFALETNNDSFLMGQACAIAAGDTHSLDLSQTKEGSAMMKVPSSVLGLGKVESLGLARSIQNVDSQSFVLKLSALGSRDLKNIDLEGNRLTAVPDVVLGMPKLECLSMRDNALRSLTPAIAQLGHILVELDLRANFLETLPESIGKLRSLRLLSAGRNMLKTLPESIGELQHLNTLWLSHNRLKELPASCACLPALEDLNLHDNRLRELPDAISAAPQLSWLSVGKNQLAALPPVLLTMQPLKILHLQHNAITALPQLPADELTRSGLRTLWLSGNPITPEVQQAALEMLTEMPKLKDLRLRATDKGMPVRSRSIDDLFEGREPCEQRVDARRSPSALRRSAPSSRMVVDRRVSFSGSLDQIVA